MNKSVLAHSPAIRVGTPPRHLRSLVAVLLVALASLGATIGFIASDDSGPTSATSVANNRSAPTLADPFQSRTQPTQQLGGPTESAVAAAISPQPSVSGPDESAIAAAIGQPSVTGPEARFQAYQDKLESMTPQQRADAFAR